MESTGVRTKLPAIPDDPATLDGLKTESVGEGPPAAPTSVQDSKASKEDVAPPDEKKEGQPVENFVELSILELDEHSSESDKEQVGTSNSELDDILDISSIKIRFNKGHLQGKTLELDVTFQVGNIVSVILPSKKRPLLRYFGPETELPDIQVTSPVTVFDASGKILGKTDVKSGPNKGDFMLDIIVYSS